MKKTFKELQDGNKRTQGKVMLILLGVTIVIITIAHYAFGLDLSQLAR